MSGIRSCTPALEQISWGNAQRFGDQADVLQANVAFAPFNPAEVTSVQADLMGEFLLAPAPDLPKLAYALTEESFYIGLFHKRYFRP